jgi:hypothetical protein
LVIPFLALIEVATLHFFPQIFGGRSEKPLIITIRLHDMNGDLIVEAAQVNDIKVERVLRINLLDLDLGQLARNLT